MSESSVLIINSNLREITPQIVRKYGVVLLISDPEELELRQDDEHSNYTITSPTRIEFENGHYYFVAPGKNLIQQQLDMDEIINLLPKDRDYIWAVSGFTLSGIPSHFGDFAEKTFESAKRDIQAFFR